VEEKLFNEIAKRGQDKNINIYEYVRSGWTFHAKGIWMSYPHKPNSPSITIIGSANLGERSSERDLEAQLMIVTSNAQLKKKLEEERNHLFNGTELVTKETFQRTDRKASFFTRLLCSVFSDFL
jgi:CDP-diacylglycerol--glycerol-3-phosphate 3-phosphatidyltransferase